MTTVALTNNAESLKERNLEFKTFGLEMVVLKEDLDTKKASDITIYASRYTMIYSPDNDFKPNIKGNNKLPQSLIKEYYTMLDEAETKLGELKVSWNNGSAGTGEGPDNQEEAAQLNRVIDNRNKQINEMAEKIEEMKQALETAKAEAKKKTEGKTDIEKMQEMVQALHEVQAKRVEVKLITNDDESTTVIEELVHSKFADILGLLADGESVYLHGPAGTGKSKLAEQLAKALKLDFYPASTLTQEFKISGFTDGNGLYHDTGFYKAYVYGGVYFLDEMDSCVAEVLVGINGALANGYYDFPDGIKRAHKNFRVIGAGNTIGRGGDDTYIRNVLDMSTLDRFWAVYLDYDKDIDLSVAKGDKDLVEFAHEVRRASEETGVVLIMSYRSISRIAGYQHMFSLPQIMDMALIKGTAPDDVLMLARNMKLNNNNKYYKAFREAV
jgi:adenosyl cobinamide kinase/adenosyl cobinamide phosphate guanylyltransferase